MIKTNTYFDKADNATKTAVGLVEVDTLNNEATLLIGKSRELIEQGYYYEKSRPIKVKFNRVNGNPYKEAYLAFKNFEDVRVVGDKVVVEKPYKDWVDFYI